MPMQSDGAATARIRQRLENPANRPELRKPQVAMRPRSNMDSKPNHRDGDVPESPTAPSAGAPASVPTPEPLTGSGLLKLFLVPGVIVATIVGAAMIVVVLFGAISNESQLSIDQLLAKIEASSGDRSAGGMVLLPREKELWQAALELSMRLKKKEAELTPKEVAHAADRLAKLLTTADGTRLGTERLSEGGRRRLHLLLRALAATEEPSAVPVILAYVDDGTAATRCEALIALGSLAQAEGIKKTVPRVVEAVNDEDELVRTVACVLLASLVDPENVEAVEALTAATHSDQREVSWNASLTLARLGSDGGKLVLLDLLSRDYWQKSVEVETGRDDGTVARYPMRPDVIERYLIAAIDAASNLDDEEVWERIRTLTEDSSSVVVDTAVKALAARTVSSLARANTIGV